MSEDPERRLTELVQELTVEKKIMAEEILKISGLLREYLEFHDDVIVVKNQESLSRRAVLAFHLIGRFLLYIVGRLDSPDTSIEDISLLVGGGSESPELVIQEFLNAGWILMTSSNSFRLNFRKVEEMLKELLPKEG